MIEVTTSETGGDDFNLSGQTYGPEVTREEAETAQEELKDEWVARGYPRPVQVWNLREPIQSGSARYAWLKLAKIIEVIIKADSLLGTLEAFLNLISWIGELPDTTIRGFYLEPYD